MASEARTGVSMTGWYLYRVMAGLVPAIHGWRCWRGKVVGGRAKPGHDTVATTVLRAY
jgi:hypothetical protein